MKRKLLAAAALVGLVCVVGAPCGLPSLSEWRCEEALLDRRFSEARDTCTAAYERSPNGKLAASVAMAHLGTRNAEEAWRWASLPISLSTTRGIRIRGALLFQEGKLDRARADFESALTRALKHDEPNEAARAAHALAGIHWAEGRYSAAFEAVELSRSQATKAEDGPALALAELARGDIFRSMGDGQQAEQSYRRAIEASARWPSDQAFALMKLGILLSDRGSLEWARAPLEEALRLSRATNNGWVSRACAGHLARILLRLGHRDLAEPYLQALDFNAHGLMTRALAAVLSGQFEEGRAMLRRLEADVMDLDDQLEAALILAELELAADQYIAAEAALLQAISIVEQLSLTEPEHQGWVVARRRRAYDLLFALHAENGAHEQAWAVFARYSQAESLSLDSATFTDFAEHLAAAEKLRERWRELAHDASPLTLDDGREVLVLHESEGRFWVGSRRGGAIRFQAIDASDTFSEAVHLFVTDPADRAAAERIGETLWRAAALAPSDEPLYVVSSGRLRRLAIPALRVSGAFWVSHRPIARLPSLSDSSVPIQWREARRVVGDPHSNLRRSREEAEWVARTVRGQLSLGHEASVATVLETQGDALLHVASHASVGLEGGRLLLADGEVSALDVLRYRPHARLVVLASCASSVGREASGSDSLATAFLRAGSRAVVSTLQSVPDEATQQMVRAFYEHGGLHDPVRALAQAQVQLSRAMPISVWASFTIAVDPRYH